MSSSRDSFAIHRSTNESYPSACFIPEELVRLVCRSLASDSNSVTIPDVAFSCLKVGDLLARLIVVLVVQQKLHDPLLAGV